MLGVAAGFASFYLMIGGVGLPLARYVETKGEEYYATGIAGEPVNVYAQPSLGSKVIGTLDPLTNVDVVARKDGDGHAVVDWYKIKRDHKEGWIPDMIEYYTLEDFVADPDIGQYIRLVERAGKSSEDFLLEVLRTTNVSPSRDEALTTLGNYNSSRVIDALMGELGRTNRVANINAYLSLGEIARSEGVDNVKIMEALAKNFEDTISCHYQHCEAEVTDALVNSARTYEDRQWLINFLEREGAYAETGNSNNRWKSIALRDLSEKQK